MALDLFLWVCPFSKTSQVYKPGHSNTLSVLSLSIYVKDHCFSVCGVASLEEIQGFMMNNKDTPPSPTVQEITRVLEALCQNRDENQTVLLIASQYFTCIISFHLHSKSPREVMQ